MTDFGKESVSQEKLLVMNVRVRENSRTENIPRTFELLYTIEGTVSDGLPLHHTTWKERRMYVLVM